MEEAKLERVIATLSTPEFAADLAPTDAPAVLIDDLSSHPAVEALAACLHDDASWEMTQRIIAPLIAREFVQGARFPLSELLMALAVVAAKTPNELARRYLADLSLLTDTVEFRAAASVAEALGA